MQEEKERERRETANSKEEEERDMANNVFGDPINDPSQKPIQRAYQALKQVLDEKIAVGKDEEAARKFVQDLKSQYGNGVSALCLLYNATGNTITLSDTKDWYGEIWKSPYPKQIQNGQWGAFLHTKSPLVDTGSMAAVVYRGRNGSDVPCDYLMSWMVPSGPQSNSVCTQVNEPDYFRDKWDMICNNFDRIKRISDGQMCNGCFTFMSTDTEKSPMVVAIFTLQGATRGATSIPRSARGVALVGYDVNAADSEGDAAARANSEADAAAT